MKSAHHIHPAHGVVHLLGKAADAGQPIDRRPLVETGAGLKAADDVWADLAEGLAVATVQETDLAGHAEDARRYGEVLSQLDARLMLRLKDCRLRDRLVVTPDHGDDPDWRGFACRAASVLQVVRCRWSDHSALGRRPDAIQGALLTLTPLGGGSDHARRSSIAYRTSASCPPGRASYQSGRRSACRY